MPLVTLAHMASEIYHCSLEPIPVGRTVYT
jgi:hypothetical protein